MAESSDGALTPDGASHVAAARQPVFVRSAGTAVRTAEAPRRFAASRPEIHPLEDS